MELAHHSLVRMRFFIVLSTCLTEVGVMYVLRMRFFIVLSTCLTEEGVMYVLLTNVLVKMQENSPGAGKCRSLRHDYECIKV